MKWDHLAEFEASLVGRSCAISRREHDWGFDLAGGVGLAVGVPWRIVSRGRIAVASADDGQLFGLASPVDVEAEARRILGIEPITSAAVDRETADVALHFGLIARIDVFNDSSGYEGWNATYIVDGKRRSVIALGGGEVAFLAEEEETASGDGVPFAGIHPDGER